MSPIAIGDLKPIDLVIWRDSDLNFDVYWWADVDETVAINFASATFKIMASTPLDLSPRITFADNTALVRVPAADIAALTEDISGYVTWLFIGVDLATNTPTTLMWGLVYLKDLRY